MTESINHDGLARLAMLELTRMGVSDRAEAHRILKGRVGAYDENDAAINAALATYFKASTLNKSSH